MRPQTPPTQSARLFIAQLLLGWSLLGWGANHNHHLGLSVSDRPGLVVVIWLPPYPHPPHPQGNCNHHLSLPDSGWLRLLVTISGVWIPTKIQLAGFPLPSLHLHLSHSLCLSVFLSLHTYAHCVLEWAAPVRTLQGLLEQKNLPGKNEL